MTYEDELLALEQRVLKAAAGDFLLAVQELRRMLAAGLPGVQRQLVELAIPEIEQAARAGVVEAFDMGGDWALGNVAGATERNLVGDAELRLGQGAPLGLFDPFIGLDAELQEAKQRTLNLVRTGSPVEEAAAPIFAAADTVKASVETQINAASNQASLLVGEAVRSPMVWEAERDACVYCLALAGQVVEEAGNVFPAADLYAPEPRSYKPVQAPPRHPHCRCRIAPLADAGYAVALRREAQRSILRGFALPSESQAVRIRATARLLAKNPSAPKSVIAYAERAVRLGRYPRGRTVPSGGPRLIVR